MGRTLGNIRKIMPKWHARDPRSEFVIIPEASHCTNIDNPAFFNRTALDWLGRTLHQCYGSASSTASFLQL